MKDYFLLAFNNLKRRKVRSWLTMIGIFIGIAAVVALISLGQGLQTTIEEQFERLGGDTIMIRPDVFAAPGSVTSESLILTKEDLEFLKDVRGVKNAAGYVSKVGKIEFKKEQHAGYIGGVGIDEMEFWQEELNFFGLERGRILKDGEKYKVIVGFRYYNGNVFEKEVDVGDKIEIEAQEFKVVGVMKKTGDPTDDSSVYIPKETLREILDVEKEETVIMVKVEDGFEPDDVAEEIKRKLAKFRDEKEGEETFSVQTSEQLLESFNDIFAVVQAVLVGIAAISLLVGGIGIMNTMYTAVLERTKEIGTMKAVGAKNSDILIIFLFESGLLGLVGGAIGVLIGIGLGKGAEYIASMALDTNLLRAVFPWYLVVGALLFSFLIGMSSGVFPAMQASRLKPAEALRYE